MENKVLHMHKVSDIQDFFSVLFFRFENTQKWQKVVVVKINVLSAEKYMVIKPDSNELHHCQKRI